MNLEKVIAKIEILENSILAEEAKIKVAQEAKIQAEEAQVEETEAEEVQEAEKPEESDDKVEETMMSPSAPKLNERPTLSSKYLTGASSQGTGAGGRPAGKDYSYGANRGKTQGYKRFI